MQIIKCLKCGEEFCNKLKLSAHIRFIHHMSMPSYKNKYGIEKCIECGKSLYYGNKTGQCKKCFDAVAYTKKLWKNVKYRKSVIDGVSKPRRKGFGAEQSQRLKEMYKNNPEQREIRSRSMKKSWKEKRITRSQFVHSINKSVGERELLLNILPPFLNAKSGCTIRGRAGWFFPDILLVDDNIILEYFGDYWHANPKKYSENDIVHHGITSKEIWAADAKRIKELEELGYRVEIVWEMDFIENKEGVVRRIINLYNWESCIL